MPSLQNLSRFLPDQMTLLLLAVVAAASLFPAQGRFAVGVDHLSTAMIALLFFMHGARLSREAVIAGLTHWRLHVTVLAFTFLLFPLLGLLVKPLALWLLTPELYLGILYLCLLPSTVQSSIGFTSIARGNVAAAVCSASASNFLGIFLTPLLVSTLLISNASAHSSLDAILKIVVQLLLPFIAGQLLRPWLAAFVHRHNKLFKMTDQASILLVVYVAFGEAVNQCLWQRLPISMLAGIFALCALMLTIIMVLTTVMSRRLGFNKEDEIAIVFCGSKKSLASGVPMAKVLFASGAAGAPTLGMILLPIMLFHQLQLMVCAVLATRYARRTE
jgi:solute carrier family 10 (sodium/bile acid cotransporter), member 7